MNVYAEELHAALRGRHTVPPLTGRVPGLTIDGAYAISLALLERRLAEGEKVIGKKIGVTSPPVQQALGVFEPDFGYLTDRMRVAAGDDVPVSTELIQPRAEGEIAFLLSRELRGPGITEGDVLAATERIFPCFEIVDSRIEGWKIRIEDTIADNASSGLFVVGTEGADPRGYDFVTCGLVVEKNGKLLSTGAGAAALGSPLRSVAWLANTQGARGVALLAGELVLSGSLVPLEPVRAGDHMRLRLHGTAALEARFT